ncbi:proteoglycan 4 [Anopheles cruzii]|uniref:proteoglycan 4 n=1 Tax=Anopheles cruzii TaxID=68878 RepID=UPI0022EC98CC|nr:proteoglycan 4 [Anopheles cruzii]
MPTQKKKGKKTKENKSEPKPAANIKQEPEELKPLAEYIDDRLELIRQVFSCVKPKEIKYLLPDFLEGKSNDIIKERCLDELLGISTKRLRAVINNTKCPTDTESDSENSDVEKIEEHISLDEISSDSDADAKRSKRSKIAENAKQTDARNGGGAKSEKEMTVLELLELQARARAIRSQLALEPITKIEIDSEHEEEHDRHGDVDTDDEVQQTTRKRVPAKMAAVEASAAENGKQLKTENTSGGEQHPRRVRLKRNFRIRQVGEDSDDDQESVKTAEAKSPEKTVEPEQEPEPEPCEEVKDVDTAPDKVETSPAPAGSAEPPTDKEEQPEELPQAETSEDATEKCTVETVEAVDERCDESNSREPDSAPVPAVVAVEVDATSPKDRNDERESSPEVIPVEESPETLCISSDSEEERLAKKRASIFVPNIEELDRQAKEPPPPPAENPVAEDTEPEEGELSEEDEEPPPAEPEAAAEQIPEKTTEEQEGSEVQQPNEGTESGATEDKPTEDNVPDSTTNGDKEPPVTETTETEIQLLSSGTEESGSESDDSSGSSSNEAESEQENKNLEPPPKVDPAMDDADIVEIHDSGDETLLLGDKPVEENPEEKSWNSRWLRSNRVAKVMAASRLGNKVREKLKKKKQIQQQAEQQQKQEQVTEAAAEAAKQQPEAVPAVAEQPSNVEVGSVEHYRELVAQQESKD